MFGTFRLGLIAKSIVSVPIPLSPLLLTYSPQYLRITLNYITLSFFLFSFFHCFTQGILQSFLYTTDDTWGSLTSHIVANAHINSTTFPQSNGHHGYYSLELCDQVPVTGGDPHPCVPFFTAGQPEPIKIPRRFLPPDAPAHDPDASFVRQPLILFFLILLNFLGAVLFRSVECGEFLSWSRFYPPLLPFLRPHQLGSSTTPLASKSTHRQHLTG